MENSAQFVHLLQLKVFSNGKTNYWVQSLYSWEGCCANLISNAQLLYGEYMHPNETRLSAIVARHGHVQITAV